MNLFRIRLLLNLSLTKQYNFITNILYKNLGKRLDHLLYIILLRFDSLHAKRFYGKLKDRGDIYTNNIYELRYTTNLVRYMLKFMHLLDDKGIKDSVRNVNKITELLTCSPYIVNSRRVGVMYIVSDDSKHTKIFFNKNEYIYDIFFSMNKKVEDTTNLILLNIYNLRDKINTLKTKLNKKKIQNISISYDNNKLVFPRLLNYNLSQNIISQFTDLNKLKIENLNFGNFKNIIKLSNYLQILLNKDSTNSNNFEIE